MAVFTGDAEKGRQRSGESQLRDPGNRAVERSEHDLPKPTRGSWAFDLLSQPPPAGKGVAGRVRGHSDPDQ